MFTAGFAGLWGQFLVMLECFNHPVSIWRIYLAPVDLYSTCASALKSKGLKNTDDVLAYFWLAPFRAEREGHCVPVALWDGSVWGGRGQHRHSERLVWCGFTYQCPHDRWKARTPGPLGLRAPPPAAHQSGKVQSHQNVGIRCRTVNTTEASEGGLLRKMCFRWRSFCVFF